MASGCEAPTTFAYVRGPAPESRSLVSRATCETFDSKARVMLSKVAV